MGLPGTSLGPQSVLLSLIILTLGRAALLHSLCVVSHSA